MLVVNTKEIFLLNLHQNRVHFPAERNAFVLDHQRGRRDATCKPAIPLKLWNFKSTNFSWPSVLQYDDEFRHMQAV